MKEKKCPRCGKPFICHHNDQIKCQCTTVTLSKTTAEYLKTHYTDCLCVSCLQAIAKDIQNNQ